MYETTDALFTGICDAIRDKDGTTALISHQDIPERIAAISGGGDMFTSPFYTYNGAGMKLENMVASNFGRYSAVYIGTAFCPQDKKWEIQAKFKTPNQWRNIGAPVIFASVSRLKSPQLDIENNNGKQTMWLGISNNGSSWTHECWCNYDFALDTWYWAKVIFDGERYIVQISNDGNTFEEIGSIYYAGEFYQPESNNSFSFGSRTDDENSAWGGSIDLKDTYIKIGDEVWWGAGK